MTTVLVGCFDPVEFPTTPFVEFESIEYNEVDGPDSLVLSFRFEDGDSDIGLGNDLVDLLKPYQIYNFIIDSNDNAITISDDEAVPPFFSAPVLLDQIDGVPVYRFFIDLKDPFSDVDNRPPYDCENYEIMGDDTVYVSRNEFHHNFHVEFLERQTSGEFTALDFQSIFNSDDCNLGNFNGRIPIFDSNGKEGLITYTMLSQAFRLAFQDDSIKIRFWVYDRALNKSNVVESPAFLLRDL